MNSKYFANFKSMKLKVIILIFLMSVSFSFTVNDDNGWQKIFNGHDFTGWIVPEGDGGHWRVVDGVIDYDARSKASGDKNLWTKHEYGDFVLKIDWRITATPWTHPGVPLIRPDGTHQLDENGEEIRMSMPVSDSGVYLRGTSKAQINIWTWPIGSGEVYGYRMDRSLPPAVRAGVTPRMMADNHVGEWNTFEITMVGDYLTVVLNGRIVIENALLPDVPGKGQLALQHHGSYEDGEYRGSPSLVQFRNIYIKEL